MNRTEKLLNNSLQVDKPKTYSAAQLIYPKKIEFVKVMSPVLEPHQVLIKITGCGICVSDLPYWIGSDQLSYPLPPGAPGHEAWGEILEMGSAVDSFKIGQRVTFVNDRAFAERTVVEDQHLLALPEGLGQQPFPGQAFASIMNVYQRGEIQAGDTVAIIGQDIVARGLLQLCAQEDVQVIVLSDNEAHLQESSAYTPHCFFARDTEEILKYVEDVTDRRGCNRVIECSGKQQTLNIATRIASPYAKVIVAGYHLGGFRQIDLECCYNKSLDIINAHEVSDENKKKGIVMAAAAVLEGVLDPKRLLTKSYSFQEIEQAFDELFSSRELGKSYLIMED